MLPTRSRADLVAAQRKEYRLLALGAVDFVIHARPTAWDFSAGALAVSEAGGAVGFLDGRDYAAQISRGCLIAAGSEASLERLREYMTNTRLLFDH